MPERATVRTCRGVTFISKQLGVVLPDKGGMRIIAGYFAVRLKNRLKSLCNWQQPLDEPEANWLKVTDILSVGHHSSA